MSIAASKVIKFFPVGRPPYLRRWLGLGAEMKQFAALAGVSLAVERGELLGVLGRNGAGKSTLLRVLADIYPPDEGSVTVDGSIGGLFELGGVSNPHLTGREFVRRYMVLTGVEESRIRSIAEEVRDFAELDEYFDQSIRTYSAGMAARLYFATATAVERDVYFVDEVLSVGDEHFQVKSWARMRERLSAGAAGVIVTHDWSAVIKLCRRACILQQGRIVKLDRADRAVSEYLQLGPPDSPDCRIEAAARYEGESGEPLRIDFRLETTESVACEAAISIEALHFGVGWEPVLISDFAPLPPGAGTREVSFMVPSAPLRAGTYALGIFVTRASARRDAAREALTVRSWTFGNPLELTINGPLREDLAPFPIVWRQETP